MDTIVEKANYITSTTFSILSNEDIQREASVDITNELFTATFKRDILSHSRFGPDPIGNQLCVICKQKYKNCNGHYGQFSNVKLYRNLFVPNILKVLKNVCSNCKAYREKKGDKKDSVCQVCSTPKTKYIIYKYVKMYKSNKVEPIAIAKEVPNSKPQIVSREQVFDILSNVSPSVLAKLGSKIKSGEDLMWTSFPILPKMYRKNSKVGDKIMKSHIESLYQQIAKQISERIANINNVDKLTRIDNMLQVAEMQLVDGEKYKRSDGSKNSTIIPKLVKKEGMIIHDLICKRVNNCLRAVIIPASEQISINEIGVPKLYAQDLIVYEYVTQFNIHKLNEMLLNKEYPQIKYRKEVLENGDMIDRSVANIDKLHIGDLIARPLVDGDEVLVNRSPTLTKNSILCFKARITSGDKAISLHLATCAGYGADFDGDEMSLFVLKHPRTRIECYMKMSSSENLFSSGFSGILIALIQDLVAALRILTRDIFHVHEYYMKQIIQNINTDRKPQPSYWYDGNEINTNKKGLEVYSGKSIFSLILPKGFNYDSFDDSDKIRIKIRDGELIEGEIDKFSVMKQQKGLINAINDLYGEYVVVKFIDNMHILASNVLRIYGLTTGLHDFYFSREQMKTINEIRNIKYTNLYKNVSKYESITPTIDLMISNEINTIQNSNDVLPDIMKNEFHHFHDIVTCGAKGTTGDINKMCYSIGQTYIGSERYIDRSPYIAKFDNTSKYGLGIIESGYLDCLNVSEIQMGNQNALNSEIIKHLSVAKPGYINTRVSEAVRDNIFISDFTVRNPLGEILIPHYFNSFDTEKETQYIIKTKLEDLTINSEEEESIYNMKEYSKKYNKYITRIFKFIDIANKKLNKYEVISKISVYLPFDFELMLLNYNIEGKEFKNMKYIIDKIDSILEGYNTSPFKEIDNINKIPMVYALYYYFNPKRISISKETYDILFEKILEKIIFSQLDSGTAILLKSGTSYLSVVSQELLKSIHNSQSRTAEKSLEDTLSVTKTISNEVIKSYIEDDNYYYRRLIISELTDEITCIYGYDNNKRKYRILYSDDDKNKIGLVFTFKFNLIKLITNKILLPYIFVNMINNINDILESDNILKQSVSYLHISSSGINELPSINIVVNGTISNVRLFIIHFIKLIKNINIRETNIKSIFVYEREYKYKQCLIEGIKYKDALQLPFVKHDYILTSHLYSVYKQYGMFGYLSASLINLFQIGKDNKLNPKHAASISCVICYNNQLISLNRLGFDKISTGKWSNIAFESQTKLLIKTASNNITDHGISINSQNIYGHKLKLGTNHSQITYNLEKVKNMSKYKLMVKSENSLYNLLKTRESK